MNSQKKKTSNKNKQPIKEENINDNDDDILKPDDQLDLSLEELDEMYSNIFYLKEPIKFEPTVIYDNKDRSYVAQKDETIHVIAYLKSTLLFRGSTEAEIQFANELCKTFENPESDDDSTIEQEEEQQPEFKYDIDVIPNEENIEENMGEEFINAEEMIDEDMGEMGEQTIEFDKQSRGLDSISMSKKRSRTSLLSLPIQHICVYKKILNKINYFNRITQTEKCILRDKCTKMKITKTRSLNKNVSSVQIYDSYNEDYLRQQEIKEKEKREKMTLLKTKNEKNVKNDGVENREQILMNLIKMFDKIITLNETDAIAQDFRYYEDPSDIYRSKGEGTLMPMWTMVYQKAKTFFVTDISWNSNYFDLFGVTLGIPQGHQPFTETPDMGYVCLWSLKNMSCPEYVAQTHCSALCLNFHKKHTNILAVGLRDGSVAVYNVKLMIAPPQYKTTSVETKHMSCVRQIVWSADLPSGEMNFFSVSEDGTVCQWLLLQNEMVKIIKMYLVLDNPITELGGIKQTYYARGTTLTFNPHDPEVYFIGTTEGYVFKCNVEWNSYMQRFQAHLMPVIRIDFNKYNSNIYLTCSEDYLVKLWEDKLGGLLYTFDLKTALSDVCWSPFSSTTFCVTTATDCRIFFYDLDVSTNEPVCEQLIQPAGEYRLTRVFFDSRVPLVVIGSSKSTIVTLKLSPNLRTKLQSPKKGIQIPSDVLEQNKLEEILNQIRE